MYVARMPKEVHHRDAQPGRPDEEESLVRQLIEGALQQVLAVTVLVVTEAALIHREMLHCNDVRQDSLCFYFEGM
jgi:hypothetical protein